MKWSDNGEKHYRLHKGRRSTAEDFLPYNGNKNKIKTLEKCRKDQNIHNTNKLWKSELFHKVKKNCLRLWYYYYYIDVIIN